MQTHPQVVFGDLVCRNYDYVPPEEFLKPDAAAELARLLRNLVDRDRAEARLQRAREQLQNLARRLVVVQETERREIARELHDEIGQRLTAAKLVLEKGARSATSPLAQQLGEARTLITELLDRVRELSLRRRPAMLEELGLIPTLRWYLERYQRQTGVTVSARFEDVEQQRFPAEIETAVYRIIQEALTNVARHARVSQAALSLWVDKTALRIRIEDRGVGFDPDAVRDAGLVGMRERVLALGGGLSLETSPGTGVRITVTLPLPRK